MRELPTSRRYQGWSIYPADRPFPYKGWRPSAIERYKYRAINENGRVVRGTISASSEGSLYKQLKSAGMELVDCRAIKQRGPGLSLARESVKLRDIIQFFIHMDQMQSAGVPLLDALSDIRDTAENGTLRDVMTDIYRDVSDGASLSESMEKHPKVFAKLQTSLVKAGEDTGDLTSSYRQLVKYLKWVDEMRSRVKKATRYPIVVVVVVILTIVVMMGFVVPQIVGFIKNLDQELPFYTVALVETSSFFQKYWWVILSAPVLFVILIKGLCVLSDDFRYRVHIMILNMPVAGPIIRKISIARYAQTFGALYSSGIDVISALRSARQTVTNMALLEALQTAERYVQSGSPLSDAFNGSGEFPSLVVRMLKIGEESGNLTPVLEQVSDFYTKDVDEAVSGLIAMIEPALTGILGLVILWIAAGVFGPIYGSFENIDF